MYIQFCIDIYASFGYSYHTQTQKMRIILIFWVLLYDAIDKLSTISVVQFSLEETRDQFKLNDHM